MPTFFSLMIRWLQSLFTPSVKVESSDIYCHVYGIDYHRLYRLITLMPSVVIPRKPYYLWTGLGVYTKFIWKGVTFQIEGDPWDDSLCISPQDNQAHPNEIRDIREHLQRQEHPQD